MSAPTPDPDAVEREALAEVLLGAYLRRNDMSHSAFWDEDSDQRRNARKDADVVLAAGWSRSPRPAAEAVCEWCDTPASGTALHNDGQRHPSCGKHGWSFDGRPAFCRPAAVSEEAVEAAYKVPWTGGTSSVRAMLTAALPHLAPGQSEAEATIERVRAVLAQHWDWKAGRSLHAAVTAALARTAPAEDGAE